ncbi:MAG: hypothetical protein HQM00_00970 [Magnetococcales bacterium]|nr:hypothetical protein [Magnetococcales bacterium]
MPSETSTGEPFLPSETITKLPKAGPVSLLAALPYMTGLALATRRWKRDPFGEVIRCVQKGGSVRKRGPLAPESARVEQRLP